MSGSPVAGVVRGWVRLYTSGLPPELRDARRDEVDDDLWCEHEEAAEAGRSRRALGADLVLRLLFGIPADISWRLTRRRHSAPGLDRSPSTSTSILGVFAIVAGLGLGILLTLSVWFSDAIWTGGGPPVGLVVGDLVMAAVAFIAAAIGLAWRFQDRVSPLGTVGALLVALGGVAAIAGNGSVVPLPVGSAMLMLDLTRIGVVPRLLSTAHVAGAIGFLGTIAAGQSSPGQAGVLLVVFLFLYPVTWVAIGVSLFRGAPLPRATSA